MHYVTIDVANLVRLVRGEWASTPAGSGLSALNNDNAGSRCTSPTVATTGTPANQETGEFGFEDIINPLNSRRRRRMVSCDPGEDVNASAGNVRNLW